jgi:ParB-like chromosome segregation protein Spo0J
VTSRVAGPKDETEPVQEIPLDQVYTLPKIAAFRVSGVNENGEYFEQLVAAMRPLGRLIDGPGEPPPITVFERTKKGWPLGDGAHRLAAADKLGWTKIQARVVEGLSEDEQVLFAIQANKHGLRYGPADIRVVVGTILSIHSEWSDRRIAQESGTSPTTVGKVRAELEASGVATVQGLTVTTPRVGRDQKRRLTRGAATAKTRAVLDENPAASIRETAKKAGVSTRTVQQTKRRLTRVGDDDAPRNGAPTTPKTASTPAPEPTDKVEEPADRHSPSRQTTPLHRPQSTHLTSFDRIVMDLKNVRNIEVPGKYWEPILGLRDVMESLLAQAEGA